MSAGFSSSSTAPGGVGPLSRFLPPDFDPGRPLTLIAGQGRYPELIAERARADGLALRLIGYENETEDHLVRSFGPEERVVLKVGQVGKSLKALRQFGAGAALMAGRITPGRLFKGLHPDLKAMAILARLKERNAETIFGAVAAEIEGIGVRVLDARCFMDADLATPGLMTGGRLRVEPETLEHGLKVCKEVARLDIGQGIVVERGTVLAVEAFDVFDRLPKCFHPAFAKAGTESRALANPFQPLPGLPFAGANVDRDVGRLGLANDVFQGQGDGRGEDRDFIQIQHQRLGRSQLLLFPGDRFGHPENHRTAQVEQQDLAVRPHEELFFLGVDRKLVFAGVDGPDPGLLLQPGEAVDGQDVGHENPDPDRHDEIDEDGQPHHPIHDGHG